MRLRAVLGVTALALAAAVGLQALERASAQLEREQLTSTLDSASLKPLFLFDMRGRRDPFMAYLLLTEATPSQKTFDINQLGFSGTIEVGGQLAALFRDDAGKTYFLRSNSLYDPQDQIVPGVHGSVVETNTNNQVVLTQGESKLSFTCQRFSKRLAADGQP